MSEDIFKERGRSFEEEYFKKHEARLIAKLRNAGASRRSPRPWR